MNDDHATSAGPVVTVFRSTLRPEAVGEYEVVSERMVGLARAMPGFVDYKTFAADDGERVTIVTFASPAHHRAWRDHPEHREAQRLGRERFYTSYAIQVCTDVSESRFPR
ncbi:MAG TPA: antibiotic biosynthesis monooxygenase [Acidimicrobiales bacterium]|nr:antibiotic biosynthesis monooxygenase [Acidimicrobiales bacterium]